MLRLFRLCLPVLILGCAAPAALAQSVIYTPDQYIYPSLLGQDGNLYGTAPNGMFEINLTTNAHTIVNSSLSAVTLCSIAPDGTFLGIDGTAIGKITMAGVETVLATLPYSTVCPVLANNGDYYGGNSTGGSYNQGYLYQMTAAGAVTVLYNFTGGVDGVGPGWPMLQGSDGNLYGVGGNGPSSTNEMFRYSAGAGVTAYSSTEGIVGPIYEGAAGNFKAMATSYGMEDNTLDTITPQGVVTSTTLNLVDASGNGGSSGNLFLGGDGNLYLEAYYYYPGCSATGNYLIVYRVGTGGVKPIFNIGQDEYDGEGDSEDQYTISEFLAGNGNFYGGYEDFGAIYDGEGCGPNGYVVPYNIFAASSLGTPAVQVNLSANRILPGKPVTVTWDATSAFSDSLQQCYGYGGLSGKLATSGSQSLTFSTAGSYTPSVVCGGTQTGAATVLVGNTQFELATNTGTPTRVGYPVTLYGILTNPGTPVPTGNVEFLYNGSVLATRAIGAYDRATYIASTNGLPPGTYTITAKYLGDANYTPASSSGAITLAKPVATTTTLTTSTPTVGGGKAAQLTSAVANAAGVNNEDGTVSLYLGSLKLLTATVSSYPYPNTASFSASTKGVTPGTYSLTAQYSGDQVNAPSTSAPLAITVQSPDTITVSASPNPVPAGDNFTLSATVANIYGTPTGSVIFSAGSQELAGTALNGSGVSTATIPAGTLAAGTYSITAAYAGDSKNPSGTSAAYSLTVQ